MSRGISFCRQSKKHEFSVREAGKLGGLAVLQKHGKDHFAQIGSLGQEAMRKRYPNLATAWGKLGGRPKKLTLMEATGRKTND